MVLLMRGRQTALYMLALLLLMVFSVEISDLSTEIYPSGSGIPLKVMSGSPSEQKAGKSADAAPQAKPVRPVGSRSPQKSAGNNEQSRSSLDLSLHRQPQWKDLSGAEAAHKSNRASPYIFSTEEPQSKFDWSGRLYLDQSPEAKDKPITDTIQGGEVRLKMRLP